MNAWMNIMHVSCLSAILAGAARQPLFSVILSQSIYLSMFVHTL